MTMVNDINGIPTRQEYEDENDRCPDYSDACYPFCPQFDGQEVEQ